MKAVLVDTSVIIDYLRRKDKTNSYFFKAFSKKPYQAVISLTTVAELWAGKSMKRKDTLKIVNQLLGKCKIIAPNLNTAKLSGKILRRTEYKISFQDAQISALALENRLSLLTLDKKDFKKVKGLQFFMLE